MVDSVRIESLSEAFKKMGVPPPKHPLVAFIDFSKVNILQNIPATKVVCGFYQIGMKGEKKGMIKYGRENYDYQEGTLTYIAPGQLTEYDEISKVSSGWMLFVHPDLIRTFPLHKKLNEYSFFSYQSNEALHISEKEKEILNSILEKIEWELDSNLDDFSEEVIVTNIELLLNYSKRFYNRQFITRKRFNKNIVVRFENLLQQYFEQDQQKELGIPTVQYFAGKMNFSANYLSDLIRKGTEQSIKEHIHNFIIEQAKNKLLNTDKSISEIAFELGFEYSQYFSRLFKNKVGKTPKEYRVGIN